MIDEKQYEDIADGDIESILVDKYSKEAKKINKRKNNPRIFIQIICLFMGLLLGVYFGILIEEGIAKYQLPYEQIVGIYIGASVITGILLFFLSVPILYVVLKAANYVEKSVLKYSAKSIVGSVFGLIAGLLIAFFVSSIFAEISMPWLKICINLFLYILLGIIGLIIGFKRLSEISFLTDKRVEELAKITNTKVLDTSAIIDGRIYDLAKSGFIEGPFIIPSFILSELRYIADNAEPLKRNRGRRGLDLIKEMQKEKNIKIIISDKEYQEQLDVDAKLLKFAHSIQAKVITTDYNLGKVASLMSVQVLNVNELANAIKTIALPGETMTVTIVKQGKDTNQGLAYMDDGTMIVIENGGKNVGETVTVTVRTSLQTNAGRMIFTRI